MPREIDHLYDKKGTLDPNKLYIEYNRLYFGNKLPNVPVIWSRKHTKDCRGLCVYSPQLVIYLNPKFKDWERIWAMVLLHEQVHVEQRHDLRATDHGRKFQARMKKLVQQGAFQDLW
jgi:hypothetical protein